jgi:hypothetical protein
MEQIELNQKENKNAIKSMAKFKTAASRTLLENFRIILCVLILFVAVCFYLPEISHKFDFNVKELTVAAVVMFACSVAMYFNFLGSGTALGKKEKAFIDCSELNEKLREEIKKKNIVNFLDEFCKKVRDQILTDARSNYLELVGIKDAEYKEKYVGKTKQELLEEFPDLQKHKVKAIVKANKIKPPVLTKEMIYYSGETHAVTNKVLPINPNRKRSSKAVKDITKTAVTTVFAGSIVLDVVATPNWATVILCLLKLCVIVLAGWKGFCNGYDSISNVAVKYITCKNDLLEQALKEHAEIKNEGNPNENTADI